MKDPPRIVPLQYKGVFAEPWSLSKLWRVLHIFGPAAIVASVAIGAGETIVVVRAGAWAGYGLLWLVLASVLVKGIFVTYLLGRYTAVSGEPISERLVRVPGPRGWLLITLVILEIDGLTDIHARSGLRSTGEPEQVGIATRFFGFYIFGSP